jgi:HAD superfamily hydrolase (TIGR01509 family)
MRRRRLESPRTSQAATLEAAINKSSANLPDSSGPALVDSSFFHDARRRSFRQCKIEGRPFPVLKFTLNAPLVLIDDPRTNMERKSHLRMTLKLPEGSFQAYLFDCDGTIADSMPLHYIAWTQALGEWNCTFDEKLFYAWGGRPSADIISALNQRQGLCMPVETVSSRKENLFLDLLPQLQAVPDVVEHIEAQHGRIRFAVVSGGPRDSVVRSLTSLNLLDRFDTLVCAEDYKKGKPDPEAFLLAAARLGVPPAACLVFEDTDLGIQAATAAGMPWVKIPPPWERLSRAT